MNIHDKQMPPQIDEQEMTARIAAEIAARMERGIDALVTGKAVVTREEFFEVYKPIFQALSHLQDVMLRTARQRMRTHGFHERRRAPPAGRAGS
jgi:hypothetical protein